MLLLSIVSVIEDDLSVPVAAGRTRRRNRLAVLALRLLLETWMQFDLVDRGHDAGDGLHAHRGCSVWNKRHGSALERHIRSLLAR